MYISLKLTLLSLCWSIGPISSKSHCSTESLCTCSAGPPSTLKLLTLLSYRYSDWDYGLDVLPALELAVDQINNKTDLLPCHKLELIRKEAGCENSAKTVVGLTRGLFPKDDEGSIVGIIGPTCFADSIQASSISNRPGLQLVLLHNAGSLMVTEGAEYSNSLDILGSTQPLVDLALELIQKSGWVNIAIVYESSHIYYRSITNKFITLLDKEVNIRYLGTITSTFYDPIHDLLGSKARIIFTFTSPRTSRRLLCLAHHMKLVYPGYQWVITSQRLSDFVKNTTLTFHGKICICSYAMLMNTVLNGAFLIHYQLSTATPEEIELPNTTFKEFLQLYKERIEDYNSDKHPNATISPTYWAYIMYDAVWTWALVLDKVTQKYKQVMFKGYGNKVLTNIILKEFYSVNFQGMSGNVSFDSSHRFVNRPADLYQVIQGKEKHIACNNGVTTVVYHSIEIVPDIVKVINLPHIGIVGLFIVIQCAELVVVMVLHMFTLSYCDTKFVKASSPKLISIAFFGEYIFISTMILYTSFFTKQHSPMIGTFLCQAVWTWLIPLSFTMKMGIVTLRTWRLYRIFTHYLNPGRLISNPGLLLILGIVMLINLLIAMIWTATDPMRFEITEYTPKNGPMDKLHIEQSCTATYTLVWTSLSYTYLSILLLAMAVLSILTMRIPNPKFATTSLRVFTYLFSTVFIIGLSLYYIYLFYDPHSNIDFIIFSVVVNILSLIFLVCVVTPPLLPVLKEKLSATSYPSCHCLSC